jgi:hypothetical protein
MYPPGHNAGQKQQLQKYYYAGCNAHKCRSQYSKRQLMQYQKQETEKALKLQGL